MSKNTTFEVGDTIEFLVNNDHTNQWYRGLVIEINPDQFTVDIVIGALGVTKYKFNQISQVSVLNIDRRKEWKDFGAENVRVAHCIESDLDKQVMRLLNKEDIVAQQIPDGLPIPCELVEEVIKFDAPKEDGIQFLASIFAGQIIRNGYKEHKDGKKVMLLRKSIAVLPIPGNLLDKKIQYLAYMLFGWYNVKLNLEPKKEYKVQIKDLSSDDVQQAVRDYLLETEGVNSYRQARFNKDGSIEVDIGITIPKDGKSITFSSFKFDGLALKVIKREDVIENRMKPEEIKFNADHKLQINDDVKTLLDIGTNFEGSNGLMLPKGSIGFIREFKDHMVVVNFEKRGIWILNRETICYCPG